MCVFLYMCDLCIVIKLCARIHVHVHYTMFSKFHLSFFLFPQQRKAMELHRASLIQNTPPSTPRNSMLLVPSQAASSNSSQMFNLQEFLTRFEPEDSPTMHREMDEAELHQHARSRLRSSQQSVSQASNRSKSSSSLHSAPSSTSITRENTDHHMPVIANPAALASNLNNNNSNNNNNNNSNGSDESAPVVGMTNYNITTGSMTLVEGVNGERSTGNDVGPNSSTPSYPKAVSISQATEAHSVFSWGDASSIGSRSLSSSSTSDVRFGQGAGSQNPSVPAVAVHETNSSLKPRSYSVSAAGSTPHDIGGGLSKSENNEGLKKVGKSKNKGRSLFKRHFHRSSDNILEEPSATGNASKPPLVQRKFHKSAFDLAEPKRQQQPEAKKRVDFSEAEAETSSSDVLSLSRLTDLRHRGEMTNLQLPLGPQRSKKAKDSKKRKSLLAKPVVPSKSQEHLQEDHTSNDGSDELLSLTDMLSELDPTQPAPSAPRPHPLSPRSPGRDSIWQEYGCV